MDLLVVAIKACAIRFPYKPGCGACANWLRQILDSQTVEPMLPVASVKSFSFLGGVLSICHKPVTVLWFATEESTMLGAFVLTKVLGGCESLRRAPALGETGACTERSLCHPVPWQVVNLLKPLFSPVYKGKSHHS